MGVCGGRQSPGAKQEAACLAKSRAGGGTARRTSISSRERPFSILSLCWRFAAIDWRLVAISDSRRDILSDEASSKDLLLDLRSASFLPRWSTFCWIASLTTSTT